VRTLRPDADAVALLTDATASSCAASISGIFEAGCPGHWRLPIETAYGDERYTGDDRTAGCRRWARSTGTDLEAGTSGCGSARRAPASYDTPAARHWVSFAVGAECPRRAGHGDLATGQAAYPMPRSARRCGAVHPGDRSGPVQVRDLAPTASGGTRPTVRIRHRGAAASASVVATRPTMERRRMVAAPGARRLHPNR